MGLSRLRSTESVFTRIYLENAWQDNESRSGPGSNVVQSRAVRQGLPALLDELSIETVLDVPCGDFNWMKEVALELKRYIGADIVQQLVADNVRRYGSERVKFLALDILRNDLPEVDLVLCRDLLVHFSKRDIFKATKQLKRSKSTYLLATTFANLNENVEIMTGEWRPINLCLPPFNFPKPLKTIDEQFEIENGARKTLGLWRIAEI